MVGKTTFITRYLTDSFDQDIKATLGANIHVKDIREPDMRVKLQIWDFGGEEKFHFLLPSYASGSSGAIFMYDITRMPTLIKAKEWIKIFKNGLHRNQDDVPIFIVGSKLDLEHEREIKKGDEMLISGLDYSYEFLECSSKTGQSVDEIFNKMINAIIKKRNLK